MIERSNVPKCPNMAEQLIGTKKIQQVFANPGMVERFIKDEDIVKRIRRTFAGLYTLDPVSKALFLYISIVYFEPSLNMLIFPLV